MEIWTTLSAGKSVRKTLFSVISVLITVLPGVTQNSPENLGFEAGNFTGWSAFTGQCCPVFTTASGIDPSRHTITTGIGVDSLSHGLITFVAPGSTHYARLGNADNLAEGEALEYTFDVTTDSMILNIRFAVLLEDGLHPVSKQPRFNYRVTTPSGQLPTGCTEGQILAGSPFPGKIKFGMIKVLPWQTRSINLTGTTGQQVTIRFETGDCGPGGHFGYAYVYCDLISSEIQYTACNPDGSLTLGINSGLNGTWFNGRNSDSIHILNPANGTDYYYELNAGTGCSFTVYPHNIDSVLPLVYFTFDQGWDNMISFNNYSMVQSGSVYYWSFGDSQSGNQPDPDHYYALTGTYQATLSILQPNNCRSEITLPVIITSPPNFHLVKTSAVCKEKLFELKIDPSDQITGCFWSIGQDIYSGTVLLVNTENEESVLLNALITDHSGYEYQLNDLIVVRYCVPESNQAFVPSAFSPNGDGINETFNPVLPAGASEITLSVYNRFGQQVCHESQWRGTHNGIQSPQGVSTYRLSFSMNNKIHFQTGTLSLIV